jgi:hypothetical protein
MRGRIGPALAVAAMAAIAIAGPSCGEDPPERPRTVAVTVDARVAGAAVPPSFLGLSVEWDSVGAYARAARGLTRLLVPLERAAGSPLGLRIGGDTADQAWWNPRGLPRPPTVLQDVTPRTLDEVRRLAGAARGPLILDLNLAVADPANAAALVRAARRRLPHGSIAAVELGNEPDLYTTAHTFHVPGKVHRRVRKRLRYGPADYGRDVERYLTELARLVRPAAPAVVGGLATDGWWPELPSLLARWRPRPAALSAHLYAVSRCGSPTPPLSWLSSPEASRERVAGLAPLAQIAHRARMPLTVNELNSAPCGGRRHFSDGFAAALWLADTLFALRSEGADQAHVHTWDHAHYAPFAVAGARATARPPLAGMLAFARAAPAGSRLVRVRVHGDAVHAWATRDRSGHTRVLLMAPAGANVRLRGMGTGCAGLWQAHPRRQTNRRACARGRAYHLVLRGPTLAVLTTPRPR